ncbi:hypothetical protein [Burkholderia territorii]|uniref:hypothetical protein n=1 Tax=Burkholderia territorii TaxID=1503055 RepID=UPI001E416585|nr:hypothetical protein [Burkholderia territorii]
MVVTRSVSAPYALADMMMRREGLPGAILTLAMIGIAMVQVADVLLNGVLPRRCACVWLERHRHGLYVGAAFCYLVPPFVFAPILGAAWGAYLLYVGMAVTSLVLAFHDQFEKRHRRAACKT